MILTAFLERLDGVRRSGRGWRARCPAHEDRTPSLDLAEGADGRILLTCRARCRTEDILAALDIDFGALFAEGQPPQRRPRHRSSVEEARARILSEARRQPWNRTGVRERYRAADRFRCLTRLVIGARRVATQLGPDDRQGWELLEHAAALERIGALEEMEWVA